MYPYLKHQTELFRLDNHLVHNYKSDDNATNLIRWKFDFVKKGTVITYAVLGIYEIYIQDLSETKSESLYRLNAGRVFEIEFYDSKEESSFKLFEDAFVLVYNDMKRISNEMVKDSSLKRFSFPTYDIEAFHANLHMYLLEFDV